MWLTYLHVASWNEVRKKEMTCQVAPSLQYIMHYGIFDVRNELNCEQSIEENMERNI